MKEVVLLLEEMLANGVIKDYALFGAAAQMRYTEAVATMDMDILVALPETPGLDILSPIYDFCSARGYKSEGEAIRVGDWPVQFIPVFSRLTEEAIHEAETGQIEGVPIRVIRADYLAVIALSTGRPKDFVRILALLEAGAVEVSDLENLAKRHSLSLAWESFRRKFLDA